MLKKGKSAILNVISKNPGLHSIGATNVEDMAYNKTLVNSPFVNEVWYSKIFKQKDIMPLKQSAFIILMKTIFATNTLSLYQVCIYVISWLIYKVTPKLMGQILAHIVEKHIWNYIMIPRKVNTY
jgi:hypothetical protein